MLINNGKLSRLGLGAPSSTCSPPAAPATAAHRTSDADAFAAVIASAGHKYDDSRAAGSSSRRLCSAQAPIAETPGCVPVTLSTNARPQQC